MNKKAYQYQLRLTGLSKPNGDAMNEEPIEIAVANHDDIFGIINRTKSKNLFNQPNEAVEFAIGLKLFTEVMLRNKANPLFEDFAPAVGAFMQKLKNPPLT
jgi:hypothetical protein